MGKKADFNDSHPELREGEMLLSNISNYEEERVYSQSQCTTKRLGKTAYDIHGKIVRGFKPWFVQREEHERVLRENQERLDARVKARMGG